MASGLENMNIDEFVDAEEIFFELASQQRLSIIFDLYQKKSKLSDLSKDLRITMQEVHRNVNRLQDTGLIEKDSDGIFSLTTFGNTIIKQIPSFDFLSRHKEYFYEHTLGELPRRLRFNELYNTGRIGRRMVDKVQVAVVINEKKASVLFPTQKGETDMNLMFYSEDQLFHDWCLDYFWFRWYGSKSFEEDKLR